MSAPAAATAIEEVWAKTVEIFVRHLTPDQQKRVQVVMAQPDFMRKTIEDRERLVMEAAGEP